MKALTALAAVAILATAACQPAATHVPPGGPPIAAEMPNPGLERWLTEHPAVAGAIVWEGASGPLPWARWDPGMRLVLSQAFNAEVSALMGTGDPRGFPLADPPPNLAAGSPNRTVLSAADAFRLYVAYVGHSLALETQGRVPWSITADPPALLYVLLDGRAMFTYRRNEGAYEVDAHRTGWVVPSAPSTAMDMLTREHILGPTRLATIDAFVRWARRLRHVRGRLDLENGEENWGYRGFAPVSRVLAGTGPDRRHVTAGCWGTTGLFIAVLRAANIPVRLVNVHPHGAARGCSHAQPAFVSEGRFLSHGDDPYNRHITSLEETAFPAGRLLIDQATWEAWYGESADPTTTCSNVGRQTLELELETLSPYLLEEYCEDVRTHADRHTSRVARSFGVDRPGTAFPLSRLEQSRLWERLATKARATGACTKARTAPAPPPDPGEGGPEGP